MSFSLLEIVPEQDSMALQSMLKPEFRAGKTRIKASRKASCRGTNLKPPTLAMCECALLL
jgi:hypothetical protein